MSVALHPAAALPRHVATIDGITYEAHSWPAMHAITMVARLGQAFGDVGLGMVMKALGIAPAGQDVVPDLRGLGITLMSRGVPEDAKIWRDVFDGSPDGGRKVTCDRVRIGDAEVPGPVWDHFSSHFEGRLVHLCDVFFWIVQSCFVRPQGASR